MSFKNLILAFLTFAVFAAFNNAHGQTLIQAKYTGVGRMVSYQVDYDDFTGDIQIDTLSLFTLNTNEIVSEYFVETTAAFTSDTTISAATSKTYVGAVQTAAHNLAALTFTQQPLLITASAVDLTAGPTVYVVGTLTGDAEWEDVAAGSYRITVFTRYLE